MSQQTNPYGPGSTSPVQQTRPSRPTSNGGPVQISDIKAKLSEIDSEVRGATEVEGPGGKAVVVAGVGVVVVVIILAFILGRKRGQRKATWVEVRRL
jgi:hypothetical protein